MPDNEKPLVSERKKHFVAICPGHNINTLLTKEEHQQLIKIIDKLLDHNIKLEIDVKELSS